MRASGITDHSALGSFGRSASSGRAGSNSTVDAIVVAAAIEAGGAAILTALPGALGVLAVERAMCAMSGSNLVTGKLLNPRFGGAPGRDRSASCDRL